jgi:DNA-binding response OmpR family regulator
MTRVSILIIEDDPDIVELLQYNLEREGYAVLTSRNGEFGLGDAIASPPGLILLDLMLPGMNGLEVCRKLKEREETRDVPIIMLTAKSEEADVVAGLELGADDYVTKPFSPRELLARIHAVMRRDQPRESRRTRIELGSIVLDAERYEVLVNGEVVPFTRAEFRLLWTLASKPGRVFTRDDLVEKVTAGEAVILDRNVDVHISAIRKKLGEGAAAIGTVRGVGYKFVD